MSRPIRLQAHTHRERQEAIQLVQEAVDAHGGFVLDFQRFSNAALAVEFELLGTEIPALLEELETRGIVLDGRPELSAPPSSRTVTASLFLQFIHGDPDLPIESPKVPG